MKKLALIMSVMVCLLCFAGCNNDDVVVNGGENNNQQQEEQNPNVDNPNVEEENKGEESNEDNKVEEPKDEEPKDDKVEEPKDEEQKDNKVEEPKDDNTTTPDEGQGNQNTSSNEGTTNIETVNLYDAMTNIVTKAQAEARMPMQEAIPAEVSFSFMGITLEDFTTYVEDSIVYESMVSPADQSICLIKVNDSSKVEDLKKSIIDNCNPRKWVCMGAEKAVVVNSDNYILLAMSTADKCDSIVAAFSEEFGGNVGEVLSKMGE